MIRQDRRFIAPPPVSYSSFTTTSAATFGRAERSLLKTIPHGQLQARSVKPIDIQGPAFIPVRQHTPWGGKIPELADWKQREGYGRMPDYLSNWSSPVLQPFPRAALSTPRSPHAIGPTSPRARAAVDAAALAMSSDTMRQTTHPLAWRAIQSSRRRYLNGGLEGTAMLNERLDRATAARLGGKPYCCTYGLQTPLETTRSATPLGIADRSPAPPSPTTSSALTKSGQLRPLWRGSSRPFPQEFLEH